MKLITIIAVFALIILLGCDKGIYCEKDGSKLELEEAKQIGMQSECNQGNYIGTPNCNEITGTWWIDLDIVQEGCSPACVINVITKQAEINWRCTGLLAR